MSQALQIPQYHKLNSKDSTNCKAQQLNSRFHTQVSPESRGGCGQNQPTTRLSKTGMSQAQTVRIPQTAKLNSKIPQIAALVDYKQSSINQPVSQQTQPLQQTLQAANTIPHNHQPKKQRIITR